MYDGFCLGMVLHFIIHLVIFQINMQKMFNHVVIWNILVLLKEYQKTFFQRKCVIISLFVFFSFHFFIQDKDGEITNNC